MDKLSFELIEHITQYLNAGDALNLARTCGRMRVACISRLDPERYLQPTFKYALYLLAAMTDYGCVLSGSRALEYFIPGTADDPPPSVGGHVSDWDFLVPCFRNSVYGMMDALARCGVKWQNPLEEVFALLGKPAGSSAIVRLGVVMSAMPSKVMQDSMEPLSPEAVALYRKMHKLAWVNTDPSGRSWLRVEVIPDQSFGSSSDPAARYAVEEILFQDMQSRGYNPHTGRLLSDEAMAGPDSLPPQENGYNDYNYANDNTVHLINGYITPPGRMRQKVQLFQCHKGKAEASTPLEYIVNTYYATHVQCFISGWAAGHFYYDLARHKLSLAWLNSRQDIEQLKGCIQKYRARGYRLFRPDVATERYGGSRCGEYDDNLKCVLHHPINPDFRTVAYAPEYKPFDPLASAVADVARELREQGHVKLDPTEPRIPQREFQFALPVRRHSTKSSTARRTPAPLTTAKNGRLSEDAYQILKRDGGRVYSGKLGNPGTKLIRFTRLQNTIRTSIRADIESFRAAPKPRPFYRNLENLLYKFRYVTIERPVAIEVLSGSPSHWRPTGTFFGPQYTPSIARALAYATIGAEAGEELGNGGAPPGTPTEPFDSSRKEWRYYELLILLTPTACNATQCHVNLEHSLPPQI